MTLEDVVEQIKSKQFKLTVENNVKRTFRFLKDHEEVQSGDRQFLISGIGFRQYHSVNEMINILSSIPIDKKQKNEKLIKEFLLKNTQYYNRARYAWVIAAVSEDNYAGIIAPTNCHGSIVGECKSFCFIRPV